MGVCRSCGEPIVWVETEARTSKPARMMPLDAGPDGMALNIDDGTGNLVFTGDTSVKGNPIVRMLPKGKGNRRSHFVTCPNRDQHRKGKR